MAVSASEVGDWPQFRGPTGQGHASGENLPVRWGTTENVVWKTPVPGAGWSSPVVHRNVVYLTAALLDASGNPTSLRTLAFDTASGKLRWDREVFSIVANQQKHSKNSHASPTPVAAEGRVYVHFGHLGTAALDLSGEVVWRQGSLDYAPVHGNGGSPILVDDKLVFSCDGGRDPFIVALDKATGEIAWRTPRRTNAKRTFSFSTPLLIDLNGERQVISPGSGQVDALDPMTGGLLWHATYGEGFSVIPRPVYGHGMIFVGTGYERSFLHGIKAGGRGDVTGSNTVWIISRSAPHTPSTLLVGDELYFVSDAGIASCVDARTGKLHWNERLGGDFSASPLFANGLIYFTNERGNTIVVRASTTFEKVAENDIGERTLASLAASGPAFYLRSEAHLHRIQQPIP